MDFVVIGAVYLAGVVSGVLLKIAFTRRPRLHEMPKAWRR